MIALFLTLIFTIITISTSYQRTSTNVLLTNRFHQNSNKLNMFGSKKVEKIVIIADGKTIQTDEKTVNLRKELQNNNIDVYPLRAKITGILNMMICLILCNIYIYIFK